MQLLSPRTQIITATIFMVQQTCGEATTALSNDSFMRNSVVECLRSTEITASSALWLTLQWIPNPADLGIGKAQAHSTATFDVASRVVHRGSRHTSIVQCLRRAPMTQQICAIYPSVAHSVLKSFRNTERINRKTASSLSTVQPTKLLHQPVSPTPSTLHEPHLRCQMAPFINTNKQPELNKSGIKLNGLVRDSHSTSSSTHHSNASNSWRNGSAFDSRSKGYPFKSGVVQYLICEFEFFGNFLQVEDV
jgi:hypothetical protein